MDRDWRVGITESHWHQRRQNGSCGLFAHFLCPIGHFLCRFRPFFDQSDFFSTFFRILTNLFLQTKLHLSSTPKSASFVRVSVHPKFVSVGKNNSCAYECSRTNVRMHNDELAHFTIEKYLGVPATANHPSYSLLLEHPRKKLPAPQNREKEGNGRLDRR